MKLKNLYDITKTHVIDTTAILASTNPIYAFFENVVVGMSDEVAISARLFASLTAYLGGGSLASRGRDLSRKIFKINDRTKEKIQTTHDALYLAALNGTFAPIIYKLSGANTSDTIEGTLFTMGLSLVTGPIMGYSLDAARDLTGIKKSERIPNKISNLSPRTKKGLAALLLTGLVGANAGIYKSTPDNPILDSERKPSIEDSIR